MYVYDTWIFVFLKRDISIDCFNLSVNSCNLNDLTLILLESYFIDTQTCCSIYSDDHGFSPLHWCCKEGHLKLAELLVSRGARINATNRGDDTPLHLASAHGHKEIVQLVKKLFDNIIVTLKIIVQSG